jgi:hypothetical protein
VSEVENVLVTAIILLAPVGLIYGWFFYMTRMKKESTGWRKRITLLSLALVSLVVLLWPVMWALAPRADWGSGVGVGNQVDWIESWHRPVFRTLSVAFVVGFFGRPRLILPIAVACMGTACFWLVSTMP